MAAAGDQTANSRDLEALLHGSNGDRIANLLAEVRPMLTDDEKTKPSTSSSAAAAAAADDDDGVLHPYDDIWALRFVLSHPEDAEAVAAAKANIAWRREKAEMLQAARKGERLPRFEAIERLVVADYHGSTVSGAPMYLIRAGITNPTAMMDEIPRDTVVDFMMYRKEIGFAKCDRITRRTRVLIKLVTVNDLNHVSLLGGTDKRFQAVLGESSKLSEIHYPQLLDRAVLINVPYIFSAIWSVLKNVLSAKARSKVAICPGDTRKGDISKCPFAKLVNLETLPSFLGGRCRCKGGCICGTPNDQTTLMGKQDSDGMTVATVAARDKLEVFQDVDPGEKVVWQLQVESQGVEVTVSLREGGLNSATPLTLVPKFKHKAEEGLKEDMVMAPSKGTLIFTFDNSYSYINAKSIKYRVESIS